jgi:hypothetical protein
VADSRRARYTTDLLNHDAMRRLANLTATNLETFITSNPTVILYIATLVNAGNAKDSHAMLGETVKEAQEFNLFPKINGDLCQNLIKRLGGKRSGMYTCGIGKFEFLCDRQR